MSIARHVQISTTIIVTHVHTIIINGIMEQDATITAVRDSILQVELEVRSSHQQVLQTEHV